MPGRAQASPAPVFVQATEAMLTYGVQINKFLVSWVAALLPHTGKPIGGISVYSSMQTQSISPPLLFRAEIEWCGFFEPGKCVQMFHINHDVNWRRQSDRIKPRDTGPRLQGGTSAASAGVPLHF